MIILQEVDQNLFKVNTMSLQKGDFDIIYYSILRDVDSINLKNKYTGEFLYPDPIHYTEFTNPSGSFNSLDELGKYLGSIISFANIDLGTLTTTGSNNFYGDQYISGTLTVTGPIYATSSNAISSSYSVSSSYSNTSKSSSYSSASLTSSFSQNTTKDTTIISGSQNPVIGGAVYERLQTKQTLPTGYVGGLQLSINASNSASFDIAPGGYVMTDWTSVFNITNTIVQVTAPITGIVPAYLASANATYIALDVNKNVIQSVSPFTDTDRRNLCLIGSVVHSNHLFINVVNEIKAPIIAPANQLHDFIKAIGFLNLEGNIYSPSNPLVNMSLQKTGGRIFGLGINGSNYYDPHVLTLGASSLVTFRIRKSDGTETADKTTLLNTDLFTENPSTHVLTSIPSNRYGIFHGTLFQTGTTRLQYPQNIYSTLSDALANIDKEAYVAEQNIIDNGIFRFYLIIQGTTTNFSDPLRFQFVTAGKFGNVLGNTGGAITANAIIAALGYTPADSAYKRNGNYIYSHSGSTQSHTGSTTTLLNNASGSFTTGFNPTGITSIYNPSTNRVDFSQLSIGDMVDISLDIEVTTTAANQVISSDLIIAEGQPEEFRLSFIGNIQFKDAAVNRFNNYQGMVINNISAKNTPARFVFNSTQNATVKVNGYYFKITRY